MRYSYDMLYHYTGDRSIANGVSDGGESELT